MIQRFRKIRSICCRSRTTAPRPASANFAAADFAGSTAQMVDYVRGARPRKVLMVTECSMSDNVAVENPDVEFVRPCNLCPHMKRISLKNILDSLVYMREEVTIDPAIAAPARRAVERMINLGN